MLREKPKEFHTPSGYVEEKGPGGGTRNKKVHSLRICILEKVIMQVCRLKILGKYLRNISMAMESS